MFKSSRKIEVSKDTTEAVAELVGIFNQDLAEEIRKIGTVDIMQEVTLTNALALRKANNQVKASMTNLGPEAKALIAAAKAFAEKAQDELPALKGAGKTILESVRVESSGWAKDESFHTQTDGFGKAV